MALDPGIPIAEGLEPEDSPFVALRPGDRPDEILLRVPADQLSALRGWAGLFGRGTADEIRIAIQIHLMEHALAHLADPAERDRLTQDEVDLDKDSEQIRMRLEDRRRDAFSRPSTAGLVKRESSPEGEADSVTTA